MSRRSHGVLDWNKPASGQASWERTLWSVFLPVIYEFG
jgi:hypothetical protein